MKNRRFIQLSADEILDKGERAHSKGDTRTIEQCIKELVCRSSDKAARAEIRLRELLSGQASGKHHQPQEIKTSTQIELLCDQEIAEKRETLIQKAERSIWLSSLTAPTDDIAQMLINAASRGVKVRVISAQWANGRSQNAREKSEERIEKMKDGGVSYSCMKSTHSKALVVDERLVLIGSANLDRIHRDLSVLHRDTALAKQVIEYIHKLEQDHAQSAG